MAKGSHTKFIGSSFEDTRNVKFPRNKERAPQPNGDSVDEEAPEMPADDSTGVETPASQAKNTDNA